MGGRGASSGISVKGKKYGSEYTSVLQDENIKFVVVNEGSNTAPLETMTKGRIYVTVNKDGYNLKSVTFYDSSNKRFKQIDLDHYHKIEGKPVKPHTQYGYYHDGETRDLTTKERKMVDRIISLWENRNSK